MKLEDQVCSLELSKRLKELKVKQEDRTFYWIQRKYFTEGFAILCEYSENIRGTTDAIICATLTVAELGEMLPFSIQRQLGKGYVDAGKWVRLFLHQYPPFEGQDFYEVGYFNEGSVLSHHEDAKTEANARAQMLIYLIENKLVKI